MATANVGPTNNSVSSKNPTRPARRWVDYGTGDPADIDEAPRGIMLDADGTATIEDDQGTAITVSLSAWTIAPFSPTKVTAIATATKVYLIY